MQVTFGKKSDPCKGLYYRKTERKGISSVNKALDGLYLARDMEKGSGGFSTTLNIFKILKNVGHKSHKW